MRRGRGRASGRWAAALVALAALAVVPTALGADTTCALNGVTHVLTVQHLDGIKDVTMRTVPNAADPSQAPAIAVLEGGAPLACGAPTTSQVDTIAYANVGGISNLIIEEPRLFGPGFTPERGTSEIEFAVTNPGGILSEVILRDGDGVGDTYAIGTAGVNVDTGDLVEDADITLNDTVFTEFAVEGGAGADTVSGAGGAGTGAAYTDDLRLSGGAGPDTLTGGAGDDEFFEGPGDDRLDGGGGAFDRLYYGASTRGVVIDLAAGGPQDGGSLGRDTITSIERVGGSPFDDVLRGDAGPNGLSGAGGNDLIEGRGGDDDLDPGAGSSDTVSYASAPAPVSVDLGLATRQDTRGAGNDLLSAPFDNLIGGPGADVLRGSAADNVIEGGPGGDTVLGLEGNDTLKVRDGIPDTADCGAGADRATVDDGAIDAVIACEQVSTVDVAPTPAPSGAAAPGGAVAPVGAAGPTGAGASTRRRVSARLTGAATQKLVKNGVLVTVACPALACTARATGSIRLKVGKRLRTHALKPASGRIALGRSVALRVLLTTADAGRVRALLAAGKHPVVRTTVTVTGIGAAARTLARSITLRR